MHYIVSSRIEGLIMYVHLCGLNNCSEPQAKMPANSVRVDLQAASEAFDKLLQVPWIREAVKS